MRLFFPSPDALDQFTRQLDMHRDDIQCGRCGQSEYLVSHGHVYKQLNGGESQPVAKCVLCSARWCRQGCGHSFRLYIAERVPGLQYGAAAVAGFVCALLAGLPIAASWLKATGCLCARHAYRWLSRLDQQQSVFRQFAVLPSPGSLPSPRASTRLTLLLQALSPLAFGEQPSTGFDTVAQFQLLFQAPWF